MTPKWHDKLTAQQLRHPREFQNNPPTLRELGITVKEGASC